MSQQASEVPPQKASLRSRLQQVLSLNKVEKRDEEVHKATWRALHPANIALHMPQDPEPEHNETHRLLPHEHVEAWAESKERNQIAADERAMKPGPLLFGPIPRKPTEHEKTSHDQALKAQIETDVSLLPPLESDVVQVMRALKRSSYFRPVLEPRSEILLVGEEDVASMKRVQDMARNLLADEKLNLCNDLHRFLSVQQSYILRLLMFSSAIKVTTNTQGHRLETPDLKQVQLADIVKNEDQAQRAKNLEEGKQSKPASSKVGAKRPERPITENFFDFISRAKQTPPPDDSPRSSRSPPASSGISISRNYAVTHSYMPEERKRDSPNSAVPDFLLDSRRTSAGEKTIVSTSSKPSKLRNGRSSTESAVPHYSGRSSADQTVASSSSRPYNVMDAAVPDFLASSRMTPGELTKPKVKSKPSCLRGGGGKEPQSWRSLSGSLFPLKYDPPPPPLPAGDRSPGSSPWLVGSRVDEQQRNMTTSEVMEERRRPKDKNKSKLGFIQKFLLSRSNDKSIITSSSSSNGLHISRPIPIPRHLTPRTQVPPSPDAPSASGGSSEKWPTSSKRNSIRSLDLKRNAIQELCDERGIGGDCSLSMVYELERGTEIEEASLGPIKHGRTRNDVLRWLQGMVDDEPGKEGRRCL